MFTNEVIVECGNAKKSDAVRMNELVKAVRSGNTEAADTLFRLAHKRAYRYAITHGMSIEVAEDMAQITMEKLLIHIDDVDYVATWVKTVVDNLVKDWLKSFPVNKTDSATVLRDEDSDKESEIWEETVVDYIFLSPEEACEKAILKEMVRGILHKLPPQQGKVLFLRLLKEKSEKETAEILGISRGTVAATLNKGKKNFCKEVLAQGGSLSLFGYQASSELAAA